MEALLRSARPRSPRTEWTVDECARFAARKEFELLRLLSTDKKVFATARRLGTLKSHSQSPSVTEGAANAAARPATDVSSAAKTSGTSPRSTGRKATATSRRSGSSESHPQPQSPSVAEGAAAEVAAVRPTADASSAAATSGNSRRLRSAARSARHHAMRRRAGTFLAIQFYVRLRLRIKARVLQRDLDDLAELEDGSTDDDSTSGLAAKRAPGDRPSSSSSSSTSSSRDSLPCDDPPSHVMRMRGAEKRRKGGLPLEGCFGSALLR
jgi:hypothetical protein